MQTIFVLYCLVQSFPIQTTAQKNNDSKREYTIYLFINKYELLPLFLSPAKHF